MYNVYAKERARWRKRKMHFFNGIANALEDAIWFVFLMVPAFTISMANSPFASRKSEIHYIEWERHPSLALHFIYNILHIPHSESFTFSMEIGDLLWLFWCMWRIQWWFLVGHFKQGKKKKNANSRITRSHFFPFHVHYICYSLFAPTRFILLWYSSHGYYQTQNDHLLFSIYSLPQLPVSVVWQSFLVD